MRVEPRVAVNQSADIAPRQEAGHYALARLRRCVLVVTAVLSRLLLRHPDQVGVVSGAVAAIGVLGGFVLPSAFGVMNALNLTARPAGTRLAAWRRCG